MTLLRRATTFLVLVLAIMALPVSASATTADEAAFLAKINGLRATKGAVELCVNPQLEDMARAWAAQMAARGAISHNPNLAAQAPGDWQKIGENVGVGSNVDGLHQAFVNSAGHYANLVDKDFNQAGIGVVDSGGKKYVVEVFMKSPTLPKPAPKPAAPVRKSTAPAPMKPKPIDNLSPKLRSHRSGVAVAR